MKKSIIYVLAFVVMSLTACTKKIDASSDEAMKASLEEIKQNLSDEKKEEFTSALQLVMLSDINLGDLMKGDTSVDEGLSGMKAKIDGKSADEIIRLAEEIRAEQERKKKEQAKIEIQELLQKKEQAQKDKKALKKFEVKRSRFYKRKSGTYYVTEEPVIELTVINNTEKAVSRAYFTGTLASPERSVPWIKDDFNYSIPGGLEPGEEVTWYLSPNMLSNWADVSAPKDAILTAKVTQIDGADGEEIYSVNNFGETEQERLAELLKSYPEFEK
ncbi:DUF6694 family lipoprotein [Psychroflexus aestuariivivens]|uniref:DUF6694 family lipoprotein n=1 Tax=Psychroflexus aestuariivivens TaxID=1795040 RepID=UPI001EFF6E7B|nr:DUF6694 family lipoprotein [Psychroflexus aestuariivivens]